MLGDGLEKCPNMTDFWLQKFYILFQPTEKSVMWNWRLVMFYKAFVLEIVYLKYTSCNRNLK